MSEFVERYIAASDGVHLFVRDYACQASVLTPVVCLHGLTRNSADFESLAEKLSDEGRRVIAVDVRGRGKSGLSPDATRYRLDVYVDDLVQVLSTLRIRTAIFIGTSMGGVLTMLLAARAGERITAAVLNDIGPKTNASGLSRIAGYVGKTGPFATWGALVEQVRSTQEGAFPGRDDAFWRRYVGRAAREDSDGKVWLAYDPRIAEAFLQPQPQQDRVGAFALLAQKPVLLIRGECSDILLPDGVEAMRLVKSDLHYVEVQNVGHAPLLEEEAAVHAIEDFLSELP